MTDTPIATKERPSPFDGFEKAAPDEMIFTLLERDPLFYKLVLAWAYHTRRIARGIEDDDKREEKLRQCSEAEQIAWSARSRQRGEQVVAEQRASYNETAREIEQWRIQLSTATQRMRNASYEISEAGQTFRDLDLLDDDDATMIASAINICNDIASEREPKRKSFGARPTLAYLKGGQE